MNQQLRNALFDELIRAHDYMISIPKGDRRLFPATTRYNLLNALLVEFDNTDLLIQQLSESNDQLRKKWQDARSLASQVARIMRIKYKDDYGFEYIKDMEQD